MKKAKLLFRLRRAGKALFSREHSETPAFWAGTIIATLNVFLPTWVTYIDQAAAMVPGLNLNAEKAAGGLLAYALGRFLGKFMTPEKVEPKKNGRS